MLGADTVPGADDTVPAVAGPTGEEPADVLPFQPA